MKEALGNYITILASNSFDRACLTDTSYASFVGAYPWVKDLAVGLLKTYGHRVLNIGLTGKNPKFLYTPFNINTETCNPRIICSQLMEYANKYNCKNIAIPMPSNYVDIKPIMQELLDDRFIVIGDDINVIDCMNTSNTVDESEYPNLEAEIPQEEIIPGVCVTGPRPKNCYGYANEDKWKALQNKIYSCCKQLYSKFNVRRFGSGCAQGVDMEFFFAVQYLKKSDGNIANDVYRPFHTHGSNFKNYGMFNANEYALMLQQATNVFELAPTVSNPSRQQAVECLLSRNNVMIDNYQYVLGVFGGDSELIKNNIPCSGGTLHALRYAYSKGKRIIIINPNTLQTYRINF